MRLFNARSKVCRRDTATEEYSLKFRGELESLRFEKDAAVQREIQKSADEIQQLKNTASSLRGELEKFT